jgi:glucokinase
MEKEVLFGVDVGGTAIKFGIFDRAGKLHGDWELPTDRRQNGAHIPEQIALSLESVIQKVGMSQEQILGVGLGVPGPVLENGEVVNAPNLGWKNRNIKEELEQLTGLTVQAGNDANVAALGEMWAGSGKGHKNLVLLTLGTGVGGGIVQDGRLIYGTRGGGGEIGHMCVNPEETIPCNCGKCGCLEQYASATGVVRLLRTCAQEKDLTGDGAEASVQLAGRQIRLDQLTAKDLWDSVKQGDALACQTAEIFGEKLGIALANLAVVLNPELFLLGGGMSRAGEILLPYIRKYYEKFVFAPCREVGFGFASLGNQAGIYGAAGLAAGEELLCSK